MGKKGRSTTEEGEIQMSVFRRGKTWWYKFTINGQLIRESAKTNSKTMAKGAELARRREVEQAYNHVPKRERVPLLSNAADVWLAGKAGLAPKARSVTGSASSISKPNLAGVLCAI